jgi:hypothetical protein
MRALIGYLVALDRAGRLRVPDPEFAARQFLGLLNEPVLWFREVVRSSVVWSETNKNPALKRLLELSASLTKK